MFFQKTIEETKPAGVTAVTPPPPPTPVVSVRAEPAEKSPEIIKLLEEVKARNLELQRVRSATLNLLEDLDAEKAAVEQKVKDRTEELEHERNKLLQVTRNIRGGAILLDHSRKPVFINRNVRPMLGLPDSLDDDAVFVVFMEKFASTEVSKFFDTCKVNETLNIPEAEVGAHVFEIFFHGLEEVDKDGKTLPMYFILFSDNTEAKLLERSKSELVAVASHQLRTPLTAMRGNVEMLLDGSFGEVSKEQQELLHDIEESTIRLITMVNEMLDITKIEKGDLEMTIEEVDPVEIINSIVSDLLDYASRHQFTINHHVPSERVAIYVDKVRVRQVLQNIIDNAIKYSRHPGKLDIDYKITPEAITFSFADNGIGIPEAEQPRMFGRFYRASNTARTTSSGSGLGLYIVKSIVEQLGGQITFESKENVGTTFHITLPTSAVEKK
jgi:signal transduction histidine kinase